MREVGKRVGGGGFGGTEWVLCYPNSDDHACLQPLRAFLLLAK